MGLESRNFPRSICKKVLHIFGVMVVVDQFKTGVASAPGNNRQLESSMSFDIIGALHNY